MNIEYNDFFPTDEQVEIRAMSRAMALIEVIADPAGAAKRVKELKAATVALVAERSAAEKIVAEADAKSAELAKGEADLAERIAQSQNWINASEKALREREARISTNEEDQAAREAKLVQGETDLARRVAAHQARVKSLKETL
jgi:hypothetical protein